MPADRDAVIFLPALGVEWTDQSVETMGRRIAMAFDRSAPASATFAAKLPPGTEGYGNGLKATVATIARTDGAAEEPILDLYGFDYHRQLTERFVDRNLFTKALLLVVMIIYSVGALVTSVAQRRDRSEPEAPDRARSAPHQTKGRLHATRPREVFQLLLGALILLLFCAYAATVIYALVDTIVHINAFKKGKAGASLAEAAGRGGGGGRDVAAEDPRPHRPCGGRLPERDRVPRLRLAARGHHGQARGC